MLSSKHSDAGNVLFLILIAVALFAALSYAVTSSSRTGGSNAGSEASMTSVGIIENYAVAIRGAVQRLMVSSGCSETELSFYSPSFSGAADYNHTPGSTRCNIFHPDGGGVVWQKPPTEAVKGGAFDYNFGGRIGIQNVGVNTCAATELLMTVRVTRQMCLSLNNKSGITNPGGNPPQDQWGLVNSAGSPPPNNGKFGWAAGFFGCGIHVGSPSHSPSAAEVRGHYSGCYQSTDGDRGYFIYNVLIGR